MSYILDALRKSEETRGNLNAAQQHPAIEQPSVSNSRRIVMPLSVLLATLVAGWMIGQMQNGPETVVVQQNFDSATGENTTIVLSESSAPEKTPLETEVESIPLPQTTPTSIQELTVASRSDTNTNDTVRDNLPDEIAPITPVTPIQSTEVATTDHSTDVAIESLNELPVSLQQSMPKIQIEGHIYDESPLARMVIINGKIRRELQTVENGLTLQEITPDGVILAYRGTLFHMGIFGK